MAVSDAAMIQQNRDLTFILLKKNNNYGLISCKRYGKYGDKEGFVSGDQYRIESSFFN